MTRPSFQFYPGDWQANSNLKRCTHAEKGVWMDVMCLMHDQEEYGILRWSIKEIAQAVGCSAAVLRGLIDKEILKGVEKGKCNSFIYVPRSGRKDGDPVTLIEEQEGPIWYSSRMVKDEYKRKNAGASTRFGEKKEEEPSTPPEHSQPPRHSPTRRHGEDKGEYKGDGSSSSSSSPPSVLNTTDAKASADKSAEEMTKAELWSAGKSILSQAGMPEKQCGSFIGKLVKDYGNEIVVDAVRAAVVEQAPDPASYIKAVCIKASARASPPTAKKESLYDKNYSEGIDENGEIIF